MLRVSSTSAETPGSQGYSFIPTFYINTPLVSRTDILVDPGGIVARVAWLGSTFVPSQNHPTEPRTQTTKENEICGFALLAWEARFFPPMLFRRFINSHQPGPYRTGSSPWQVSVCGGSLASKRYPTASTSPPGRKAYVVLVRLTFCLVRIPIPCVVPYSRGCTITKPSTQRRLHNYTKCPP